jgi:hypothetical protein
MIGRGQQCGKEKGRHKRNEHSLECYMVKNEVSHNFFLIRIVCKFKLFMIDALVVL